MPAASRHSTASADPTASHMPLRGSPPAEAMARATSAPKNTMTDSPPSTVASIRQLKVPSWP